MARKRRSLAARKKERDSTYVLKLVLYLIVGSQWLYITNPDQNRQIPVPFGLLLGLIFVRHEHFQIDRKIEYALLLGAMFIGFWLPMGINIVH